MCVCVSAVPMNMCSELRVACGERQGIRRESETGCYRERERVGGGFHNTFELSYGMHCNLSPLSLSNGYLRRERKREKRKRERSPRHLVQSTYISLRGGATYHG